VKNFPSWFPGTFYANKARQLRSDVEGIYNNPYNDVLKQMVRSCRMYNPILVLISHQKEGTAENSFLEERLRLLAADGVTDDEAYQEAKGVAATLFVAGVDTVRFGEFIFAIQSLITFIRPLPPSESLQCS
jgi:hypothetical protein